MKLIASLPTIIADKEGKIKASEWKRVTADWEEMKRVLNGKPDNAGTSILLQTNDVDNVVQDKLDLKQGANVTLTDNGDGSVTIASAAGSAIALKTNGVLNTLQNVLNLIAGTHVTLTADVSGGVTFDVAWPTIPIVPSSFIAAAHKFLKSYDAATGLFTDAQPAYSDLTGTPTLAQSLAKIAHKWLDSYDATTGLFTQSQPDYSDLTGTPTIPAAALYSRGFALSDLTPVSSAAPHIRAGVAGTINKVTGVLTKTIASDLVMNLYADGNLVCTLTIPHATAVDTVIAVTSFSYTTVGVDTIFKLSITSSDSSSDYRGVAVAQVWWQ